MGRSSASRRFPIVRFTVVMVLATNGGCWDRSSSVAMVHGNDAGSADGGACTPEATEPCSCTSVRPDGARRCAADGSGWSTCECDRYGAALYVSPDGDDAADGTFAAPFATLERARREVTARVAAGLPARGLAVWLRGGTYALGATLSIGATESGSDGKPVVWRGYPGESAHVVGGVRLDAAAFSRITPASPLYARLGAPARARVLQVALSSYGINDTGALVRRGFCGAAARSPLELFVDGRPMTLARWPDPSQDSPAPTGLETADAVDLFGNGKPDVSGHYVKTGASDGASAFARSGLVGDLQYHLYRNTWMSAGASHTAWFLTTDASGYPTSAHPWWSRYDSKLGVMLPSAGAAGDVTSEDPDAIHHGFARVWQPISATVWRYHGDRPAHWQDPTNVWFHGLWRFAWADCHIRAANIDIATQTVTLADAPTYDPTFDQPFYAYNVPEEITEPGEYWVDPATKMLYLWPPANFGDAEIFVSTLDGPLVSMKDASWVELRDLTLEVGRSRLVTIDGGAHDRLVGLTLRDAGTDAAVITGSDQTVQSCDVYASGNGGISLRGGDRTTLTPGNDVVADSYLHDLSRWEWTYRPAVALNGDGNRVTNNLIDELPHAAIIYSGNDHDIALNEIRHVCQLSSDAGAIYAGRDWGARGNVIEHNFIHDVSTVADGFGVHGIYLDDCLSGVRVDGNVLYRISGFGIVHGGGRDDLIVNNIVARSGGALRADRRCATGLANGTPNHTPGDTWNLLARLEAVHYQSQPWASRWPECAAIPDDWTTLSSPPSHWLEPEGCVLARNIGFANGQWVDGTAQTFAAYAEVSHNLQDVDPQFVDESSLDLDLQPSSPAFAIPGFEPIPFGDIGIKP